MDNGLLISFEGVDGSGKTLMINHVYNELISLNKRVMLTREPGGTDIALKIREILTTEDKEKEPLNQTAQLLLFYAARIQNLNQVILPALRDGMIVLCDRYIDSTLVYQGHLNGLLSTIDALTDIPAYKILKLRPDHCIFLDVSPETSIARTTNRGDLNSLDIEYLSKKGIPITLFRKHLYQIYTDKPHTVHPVNANKSIESVKYEISYILSLIDEIKHTNRFIDQVA